MMSDCFPAWQTKRSRQLGPPNDPYDCQQVCVIQRELWQPETDASNKQVYRYKNIFGPFTIARAAINTTGLAVVPAAYYDTVRITAYDPVRGGFTIPILFSFGRFKPTAAGPNTELFPSDPPEGYTIGELPNFDLTTKFFDYMVQGANQVTLDLQVPLTNSPFWAIFWQGTATTNYPLNTLMKCTLLTLRSNLY